MSLPPLPPCSHSPVLGPAHSLSEAGEGLTCTRGTPSSSFWQPRQNWKWINHKDISNHSKKYPVPSPDNCIFCTTFNIVNITGRITGVIGRPLKIWIRLLVPKYFCWSQMQISAAREFRARSSDLCKKASQGEQLFTENTPLYIILVYLIAATVTALQDIMFNI